MTAANQSAATSSQADTPRVDYPPPTRGDYSAEFQGTDEPFSALRAAEAWLKDRGFSYGPQQGRAPIGILLGFCTIAKWFKLDAEEKNDLHGQIVCKAGNFRSGPVTAYIRRDAPHDVVEAFNTDPVDVEARRAVEGCSS